MCGGARSPVPGILTARTLYARHCNSQPVHQPPVAGRLYLEGFLPWRQCSCTRWCHRRIRLAVFQGEDGPQRRSCTGERELVGPNMLPCGIPDLIVWVEEDCPPTTTRIFRSWR